MILFRIFFKPVGQTMHVAPAHSKMRIIIKSTFTILGATLHIFTMETTIIQVSFFKVVVVCCVSIEKTALEGEGGVVI